MTKKFEWLRYEWLIFTTILVTGVIFCSTANAQQVQIRSPEIYSSATCENADYSVERALMVNAVLQKLTIWIRPADGRRIYVQHCRELRYGCERQVVQLVDYIFDVSLAYNFDPWLIAAVAWHESRFNPFAESSEGAVGIIQLLRRSPWSRGVSFVHQRWFRQRCINQIGSCQLDVIERGVYWLNRAVQECGSINSGLRMYNSGRCNGPRRYPRAVMAERNDLLRRATAIVNNSLIDPTRPHVGRIRLSRRYGQYVNANYTPNSVLRFACAEHSSMWSVANNNCYY